MTAYEESIYLVDLLGTKCSIIHIDKCIELLKKVMSGCSSTSERYEITNLIKHYKEIKLQIEKS